MARFRNPRTRAQFSGSMTTHGNIPIPIIWYEVQRYNNDRLRGTWWETLYSVKSEQKALKLAKHHEAKGMRMRVYKKGSPHHLVTP